jgi:hypothetical protein
VYEFQPLQLGAAPELFYAGYAKLYEQMGSDTMLTKGLGAEAITTRSPECAAAFLDAANFRKPEMPPSVGAHTRSLFSST